MYKGMNHLCWISHRGTCCPYEAVRNHVDKVTAILVWITSLLTPFNGGNLAVLPLAKTVDAGSCFLTPKLLR